MVNFIYFPVPFPGIAIFCGIAITYHGQQKIDLDFRLPAPVPDNKDVYRCDVKFYTEVRGQNVSNGPLTRYVKLRVRMRRECRERFPRHSG